mmetsp:Transcript_70992/g.197206  ORF Transcript_70992/g.197206 Transcript_70992/m.197206 type:complete len:203 (-) Transcript_70992:835-1443(-)
MGRAPQKATGAANRQACRASEAGHQAQFTSGIGAEPDQELDRSWEFGIARRHRRLQREQESSDPCNRFSPGIQLVERIWLRAHFTHLRGHQDRELPRGMVEERQPWHLMVASTCSSRQDLDCLRQFLDDHRRLHLKCIVAYGCASTGCRTKVRHHRDHILGFAPFVHLEVDGAAGKVFRAWHTERLLLLVRHCVPVCFWIIR